MSRLGWIYVADKPHPDHGGQVLVAFRLNEASGEFVTVARYDCGRWDWGSPKANAARIDSDIYAWKPLEEAPPLPS